MHLFWMDFWIFRFWFLVFGFSCEKGNQLLFSEKISGWLFVDCLCDENGIESDVWRDLGKFAARFWWHLWVAQQFSRVLQGGCHPQTNGASLALGLQPCSSSFSDVLWWSSNSITEWESALNENRKRNSILHIPQGFFYWKLHNVL